MPRKRDNKAINDLPVGSVVHIRAERDGHVVESVAVKAGEIEEPNELGVIEEMASRLGMPMPEDAGIKAFTALGLWFTADVAKDGVRPDDFTHWRIGLFATDFELVEVLSEGETEKGKSDRFDGLLEQ